MKTGMREQQPPGRGQHATGAFRLGQAMQSLVMAAGIALVLFQVLRKTAELVFRYGGF